MSAFTPPSAMGFLGWAATGSCESLASLSLQNTTILSASRIVAGSNITTLGICQSSAVPTVDVCRVYGVVNTTADSAVKFEMWLPDTWYGRFLGVGNGKLNGCIDYLNIDYGTTLHFATIGSDNGHDGNTGVPFFNHPEVINDFAYRAIHTEAVIGKQIANAYYGTKHSQSYFLGCSTGGRQALQSALLYPEDFDGILGGSAASDFNHFYGWRGQLGTYTGPSDPNSSFIPQSVWQNVVAVGILNQCDGLDGRMDRIITEPDDCHFNPELLLCATDATDGCLTRLQVDALRKIYSPLYGTDGQLLYPRYDPGAEGGSTFWEYFDGEFYKYTKEWFEHAVYNESTQPFSFDHFSISDIEYADTVNPGNIRTWSTDFSDFKERGGKLLAFHGRRDPMIASGNSKRLHEFIASHDEQIDDFYRLFLIPGMGHCAGGPGAWAVGQGSYSGETHSNVVNDTSHNVLLALVDWVEAGVAPKYVIGVNDIMEERVHCMYPHRSVWSGLEWICV